MHLLERLEQAGKIRPPGYVTGAAQYLTVMGSEAYGVSSNSSDQDIYGFCIPGKKIVFPHLDGVIYGFDDTSVQKFDQFQQHHINFNEKEYDVQVFNIIKYFKLCMENNPNMMDSLYTPQRCVIHQSVIGELVRSNRKIFLHKGSYHKFRGYAHAQLHKAKEKVYVHIANILRPYGITDEQNVSFDTVRQEADSRGSTCLSGVHESDLEKLDTLFKQGSGKGNDKQKISPKRLASVLRYGWDVKFGYHIVRLSDEAEQILTHGAIDLERSKEMMKAVRRGEWKLEDVEKWFQEKELQLEKLYHESNAVPYSPDGDAVKKLLLQCLEQFFGSIDDAVAVSTDAEKALQEIDGLLGRYWRRR